MRFNRLKIKRRNQEEDGIERVNVRSIIKLVGSIVTKAVRSP